MKFRFYKEEDNNWFVDLPKFIEEGGEKEDLQMISGADYMLDMLSHNGNNIVLHISEEKKECKVHLVLMEETKEAGANYIAHSDKGDYGVWLCPVVPYVFGKYPQNLYIN